MKGVMLNICPDLSLVDLTHAIQPQNVQQAAFALLSSYRFFPIRTIFLVVVDPGVGSARRAVALEAGGYTFIGPDNGVLSFVARDFLYYEWVELTNPAYRLSSTSYTFHGRDIFAPAAAHVAKVVALEALGSIMRDAVMLPAPHPAVESRRITGEILHIDHFGSVVTNIGLLSWPTPEQVKLKLTFSDAPPLTFPASDAQIRAGETPLTAIRHTYADVERGAALALVGSSGYLELAVNGGSFAGRFGVKIGDPVVVELG
jgi:S-adenosylmethionine hydrolase